jgi:hypothetical protein
MPSPPTSRPRRATKPTSRRAAAAPASSAPPRTSKVTKRVKDTAVTAGLVGRGGGARASRAKSVPAVQKEVAPEPEPVLPIQAVFRYSAQWSLRHVRDTSTARAMQADLAHQSSDAIDEAITLANAFLDRGIAEERNCKLVRKQLFAGYYGLAQANWIEASFTPSAYSALVEHLREWHAQGKVSLTIRVIALMRDVTMDDVEGSEPEPTSGAAANTSRVRNAAAAAAAAAAPRPVAPGVRNTATNRAIARQPSEQHEMEVGGNWASGITARWSCSQKSCANHQRGCCYWTSRDEATYHVPIIAPVLAAWSDSIRAGELTPAIPTHEMYGQMAAAKGEKQSRARSGSSRGGGTVVNNITQLPASPAVAPVPMPPILPRQSSGGRLYSSPVRMPSDPIELSDLEVLDVFFAWCKGTIRWLGHAAMLDEMLVLVKANGDNVHTMANISKEDWRQDIGVADGYRKRLKASVKIWVNTGMPVIQAVQGPI